MEAPNPRLSVFIDMAPETQSMPDHIDNKETDLQFCLRREKEERAAAARAPDIASSRIHAMAAKHYAARSQSLRKKSASFMFPEMPVRGA
jgi:hypothetical protein